MKSNPHIALGGMAIAVAAMLTIHHLAAAKPPSTSSASPGMAPSQPSISKRSFREWYYAGSILTDKTTTPANPVHGVTSAMTEHLVFANLSNKEATANITYYFEDEAPLQRSRTVPANSTTIFRHYYFQDEHFPLRKLFGAKITTDQAVVVQATRGGTEDVKAPLYASNFESSVIGYQGPLGKKETKWMYADGHPLVSIKPRQWSDWEYITILNPNPGEPATVHITFHFTTDVSPHKEHTLTVPAERIRNVALHELLLPPLNGKQAFYPVVESDVPVIVEQTRRPVINENPSPRGGWHLMALPIGDAELESFESNKQ